MEQKTSTSYRSYESYNTEPPELPEKPESPDGNGTPHTHPLLLPVAGRAKRLLKARAISYGDIFRETGIAKSTMYNVVNGNGRLSPQQTDSLSAYLERCERTTTQSQAP